MGGVATTGTAANNSTGITAIGSTACRHGNSNTVAASACTTAVQLKAASHRRRGPEVTPATSRARGPKMLPPSIAPLCRRPPRKGKPHHDACRAIYPR